MIHSLTWAHSDETATVLSTVMLSQTQLNTLENAGYIEACEDCTKAGDKESETIYHSYIPQAKMRQILSKTG